MSDVLLFIGMMIALPIVFCVFVAIGMLWFVYACLIIKWFFDRVDQVMSHYEDNEPRASRITERPPPPPPSYRPSGGSKIMRAPHTGTGVT